MVYRNIRMRDLSFLVILLLGACSMPAPRDSTQQDPMVVHTAAAKTISVELTKIAGTQTPTSSGPSPTSAPPTATETAASPTTTTTASPEVSPAPNTTPTITPLPSDPRRTLGDSSWLDTFQSRENWPLYKDKHVFFEVKNDSLFMTAYNPDKFNAWIFTWPALKNFYLETTATPLTCAGLDRYGLMARGTKINATDYIGYLFGVSCDGQYWLGSWNNEKYTTLVEWTSSEHILSDPGNTNRIGFMAQGEHISLYANGNLLTELDDNTHNEGKFGFFIGSTETPNSTVKVEEVAYWELP